MAQASVRRTILEAIIAVIGTGLGFAFLEAGAFTDIGSGTLQRMLAASGLRAAALGAGATALLLVPALVWLRRRARGAAT